MNRFVSWLFPVFILLNLYLFLYLEDKRSIKYLEYTKVSEMILNLNNQIDRMDPVTEKLWIRASNRQVFDVADLEESLREFLSVDDEVGITASSSDVTISFESVDFSKIKSWVEFMVYFANVEIHSFDFTGVDPRGNVVGFIHFRFT